MDQPLTSMVLMGLTVVAGAASVLAWSGLRREHGPRPRPVVSVAMLVMVVVSAALLLGRWISSGELARPLHAHVDGLVMIAMLLCAGLLFLRWRPRMLMLSVVGLPVLAFVYAWAVCAAAWTYQPFRIDSLSGVWSWLHVMGVYLGTLCFVGGAVAGGAYLYVHRRIKHKDDPASIGGLPSLERLEGLIIRCATVGFVLLSIGLVGGVVVLGRETSTLVDSGWGIAKLVMAGLVWVTYTLLINVGFATSFRGRRAAWLSIAGLVLIVATYGVITVLPPGSAPSGNAPLDNVSPGDRAAIEGGAG